MIFHKINCNVSNLKVFEYKFIQKSICIHINKIFRIAS